ncbi:Sensor histidine kinase RcsC [Alphaproteobacteria bacterium SO-S41]|nr:Sensor histidine kinase RcsC [Alphaproteobacteria bacterium SO-S41]
MFTPSHKRSLLLPFVAAFFLAVGLFAAVWLKIEADAKNALVSHTLDVRVEVRELYSLVQDAESGQRGYLITGRDSFVEPYKSTVAQIDPKVERLKVLVADNPRQVETLAKTTNLIAEKIALLDKVMAAKSANDEAAIQELIRVGNGQVLMDGIRSNVLAMDAEERRLLDERNESVASTGTLLFATLAGSGLLAIGIVWLWLTGVRSAAREIAEKTKERDNFWNLSRDMLAITDANGHLVAANPAWQVHTGWSDEELKALPSLGALIHPEDVEAIEADRAARAPGTVRTTPSLLRLRTKDGSYRWTSGIAAVDGGRLYASARDVTDERLQAEALEASEAKVLQIQKMEAIGQLTGGVAHDFNNMLAIIIGSLNLVERRLARGDGVTPDVLKFLAGAMEGATRAATLTQRLLAFARRQPLAPETINANELVGRISELLRRTLGEEVSLETVLAGGLWQMNVDAGQMEQALVNLAVNARDAMPGGGKLTIETMNAHLDDAYALENDTAAGQYVMIAVTDTGTGMTPEVMKQAFDPFYSTKPTGKGTGLGLSMVFGFIKQSGGHIKIYSEPGVGTTVKFYLPRLVGATKSGVTAKATNGELPLGDPRDVVLVVEDDDRVRRFSVDALRELGYTAIHASGAEEALRILAERLDIKLLFTDVVMPHINGAKLAEEARRLYPDLRVLFTTGYTRNAIVHNGTLDQGVDLLSKPFTLSQLAFRIRSVLDAPR